MQELRGVVQDGRQVRVRGEAWVVLHSEPFDDCAVVTLRGTDDDNLGRVTRIITPFDRVQPVRQSHTIRRAARQKVLRAAARAVAQSQQWDDLWIAAGARIDLLPWQLEPARAVLRGATRVLIADTVGLGKTVQAGLIMAEVRARGFVKRALVLTPASLREQWATELQDRFALPATVFDHAHLARLVSELPPGVNPWMTSELAIASIDLVKRPELRAALDSVPVDILVVDEAHHLAPGTDRGAAVADLASRVPWVVLITATPHSGDTQAYNYLRGLGSLGAEPDLSVFRRTADDIGQRRTRRVRLRAVTPTAAERVLFDETLAYARAIWSQQAGADRAAALVAGVLCRRAISSSRAALSTLFRRRQLLAGAPLQRSASQPALPWIEDDCADQSEEDGLLTAGSLGNSPGEIAWLDRLIALTRAVGDDWSKGSQLIRLLARVKEPAIVFSEYRATVLQLAERLDDVATTAVLHGGMSAAERREALRRFTGGGARVLVATDTAGEGLNLQGRCRIVINVELPWNPLRLEQRIGRVDRLGQQRRVHAVHLFHPSSFEATVLDHLRRRQRFASEALIDRDVERDIEAAVFGAATEAPVRRPRSFGVDPSRELTDRSDPAIRRRARALNPPATRVAQRGGTLCAASSKRRPLARGVLLLFGSVVRDQSGRAVARELVPIAASFAEPLRIPRALACAAAQSAAAGQRVGHLLNSAVAERMVQNAAMTSRFAAGALRRLELADLHLGATRDPLVQHSLFDRRTERHATARAFARAALRRRLAHLRRLIEPVRDLSAEPPRLLAAWPIEGRQE